ncbi:hypothetical protein [Pseudomonas sp. BIGb0427]|uniref:hypothetical protein n=1 Tax=Pseudomonas sp. BIGb0427 TaxID=2724470 RepID=UPI001E5A0741|nr:hypothetical protein [Pseudomonas sp. BIGb0427]
MARHGQALSKIADDLEQGNIDPCVIDAVPLSSPAGKVTAFGIGPAADDPEVLALFRLAEQQLIDVLLDCGEG